MKITTPDDVRASVVQRAKEAEEHRVSQLAKAIEAAAHALSKELLNSELRDHKVGFDVSRIWWNSKPNPENPPEPYRSYESVEFWNEKIAPIFAQAGWHLVAERHITRNADDHPDWTTVTLTEIIGSGVGPGH